MQHDLVKYELFNFDTNTSIELSANKDATKPPPVNWEKNDRTLKRSKKTYGIMTEFTRDLLFTHAGADFLRLAEAARGTEANVVMREYRMKPHIDEYYLRSVAVFNFNEYVSNDEGVKIPFKTGGLTSLIKSYMSKKFELERTTSIDGEEISELAKIIVALTSRQIFLISQLETEGDRQIAYPGIGGVGAASGAFVPNLSVVSNSDQENVQPTFDDDEIYWDAGSEVTVTSGQIFYNDSDVAKTITITPNYRIRGSKGGMDTTTYSVRLYRYNWNGVSYDYVDYTEVQFVDYQSAALYVEFNSPIEIELDAGDSLRLGILTTAGSGTLTAAAVRLDIDYLDITIEEDSTREDSQTPAVFMHEAFARIMEIFTGDTKYFKSDFYGRTDIGYVQTGEYARTAIALGFWIRRFIDENITVTLKELIEASHAIHNTGYAIEDVDGDEKLIVEDMKYFFQNLVTIRLGEVYDVEEASASEHTFASFKHGYKNPNANNNNPLYEEAMGLDEYNTQIDRVNGFKRTDNEYEKISPYRADKYGVEFARRKPKINYPEEDTKYDDEKFLLDLKEGLGEAYVERTWGDDYEQEPENVYSPSTATNLRLTPARCARRHEWFYGACMTKHQDKAVRYTGGIGNNQLSTKIVGEDALQENSDINVSDLERPRFENKYVKFKKKVDYFINEQVYGKTQRADGRYIPNFYGLVEYKVRGEARYGYLIELKPDGEGEWELLKAY